MAWVDSDTGCRASVGSASLERVARHLDNVCRRWERVHRHRLQKPRLLPVCDGFAAHGCLPLLRRHVHARGRVLDGLRTVGARPENINHKLNRVQTSFIPDSGFQTYFGQTSTTKGFRLLSYAGLQTCFGWLGGGPKHIWNPGAAPLLMYNVWLTGPSICMSSPTLSTCKFNVA